MRLAQARALLLTALCACAPTWQHAATMTEIAAAGSLACDGGTTDQFLAANAGWSESNPALGEHPSDLRLWGYLGAIAAAVVLANAKLPPKWALAANLAVVGVEIHSIGYNMHVGASACGLGEGGPWLDGWVTAPGGDGAAGNSLGRR